MLQESAPRQTEDAETYQRDGVVCLRSVVGMDFLSRLERAIERDIRKPGQFHHGYQSRNGSFHATSRNWQVDDDIRAYVFESALPQLAGRLMNSNKVNLLYDQMFVKEPRTDAATPWHCDHVVWPLAGRQVISFWLALDEVTADSGRVEYVRGSHLWGKRYQPRSFTKSRLDYPTVPGLEEFPNIEAKRADYDIVAWDLDPGDVIAFSSWTFHGASGNSRSDRRRRGFSVRYAGDDVTYRPDQFSVASLINPELSPGDPLDSQMFPIVWQGGHPVPFRPAGQNQTLPPSQPR
jgi:ectoine hydroxylase-related dioxygenase (phytanoyl-CoA dioxygenase family)